MRLKTKLLEHQQKAFDKLHELKVGALFMDMGTGKTRTSIQFIKHRLDKIDRVIWFCPVSAKKEIKKDILKHTYLKNKSIYIFNNKTNSKNIPNCLIYIVGIRSMSRSKRIISTVNKIVTENSFIVVDESHYIKGHNSACTKWITRIGERSKYRLILTGTPISQGIVDLYAQMKFLSPKILGYNSFYSFAANHLEYSEKYPGLIVKAHNVGHITNRINPFVYQITKEECLDLPKKVYKRFWFNMTNEQRDYYDYVKEFFLKKIEYEDIIDSFLIFQLFSALQQVVSGYHHDIKAKKVIPLKHNRIDILNEIIEEIPKDKKIIIWAKYNYDIEQIKKYLANNQNNKVSLFYGKLNEQQRQEQLDLFRKENRFFLATQSCGGQSITLNESTYTIFYNNEFKYANRIQAEDRNHRIGQTNTVVYSDVLCNHSIDAMIDANLYKKQNIVDSFKNQIDKIKDKKYLKKLIGEL
jgi:SNF2 family DNA or RNA helicase